MVFRSNGYAGKWQIPKECPILGFSIYDQRCPVIFVKKRRTDAQQVFTLAHELGHLLLHKESAIDDEGDLYSHSGRERDANAFAGHLLVPDRFLDIIRDEDRPNDVSQFPDWTRPLHTPLGVSTEVVLRRLLDFGRLPNSLYNEYRDWLRTKENEETASRGTRHRFKEPKHIFGDTFVKTVLDALDQNQITLSKASRFLDNVKLKDLHSLERHYANI